MSIRLKLATDSGDFAWPENGCVSVLGPTPGSDLTILPMERVQVVQPFRPYFDHFKNLGFDCVPTSKDPCAAAIVVLPRSKSYAKALVQIACARTHGLVVVDGLKTDGIDGLLREVRSRVPVQGPIAKAHGKIFWFTADADVFRDWQLPQTQMVDGFITAPGIFSADGIDPASHLLTESLPEHVGRHVADLGAGWGYLSAHLLKDEKVESVDLVEADWRALQCARKNVIDARAQFHWSDARTWKAPHRLDAVIMNPPFHIERAADPSLGRSFVEAASQLLDRGGSLWMVANRHLPYEVTLNACFDRVEEKAGTSQFKVFQAQRPKRIHR